MGLASFDLFKRFKRFTCLTLVISFFLTNIFTAIPVFAAATTLAASVGTTYYAVGNADGVAVDSGLTINADADDITGARVYISTGFTSGDTLTFTNQLGITGSYNSSNGVLTLSGTTTATNYQTALRTVKFMSADSSASGTRVISITLGSNVAYGGHYYEFVNSGVITWSNAKTAAEARTYYGLTGYLVTITSVGENTFVAQKCANDGWIGCSDAAQEGTWKWATGPETNNALTYTYWNPGEPNDAGGNEDYGEMIASSGKWNDLPNAGGVTGYLVEYGDVGTLTGTISVTKNLSIPTAAAAIDNGNEAALNDSNITVDLTNGTFADATIDLGNVSLVNAPTALTIGAITYIDSDSISVALDYNGDIDSNVTTLKVAITGAELTGGAAVTSSAVTLTAVNDAENITISSDGEIREGNENGAKIYVTLTGGRFTSPINSSNWTLTNLPAGVTKGTVTRTSPTAVEITLSGSNSESYAGDINNLTVTCTTAEYYDSTAGASLSANSGVTLAKRHRSVQIPQTPVINIENDLKTAAESLSPSYATGDDQNHITKNITLPLTAGNGVSVSWKSSDTTLVSETGEVKTIDPGLESKPVTITATLSKEGKTQTKEFPLILVARDYTDEEAVKLNVDKVSITYQNGDSQSHVTSNLGLSDVGSNGATVTWSSSNPEYISVTGIVKKIQTVADSKKITLTATIKRGSFTQDKKFEVTVVPENLSDEDVVTLDMDSLAIQYFRGDNADNVTNNVGLASSGGNGSSISWSYPKAEPKQEISQQEYQNKLFMLSMQIQDVGMFMRHSMYMYGNSSIDNNYDDFYRYRFMDLMRFGMMLRMNGPDTIHQMQFIKMQMDQMSMYFDSTAYRMLDANLILKEYDEKFRNKYSLINNELNFSPMGYRMILFDNSDLDGLEIKDEDRQVLMNYLYNIKSQYIINSLSKQIQSLLNYNIDMNSQTQTSEDLSRYLTLEGKVERPSKDLGDKTVAIIATITKGNVTKEKTFKLCVKADNVGDLDRLEKDFTNVNITYYEGEGPENVTRDVKLSGSGENGSYVIWISDKPYIISDAGKVAKLKYGSEPEIVTLKAVVTFGKEKKEKEFKLKVLPPVKSDEQCVTEALAFVKPKYYAQENEFNVMNDIFLAQVGENSTKVAWTSSDEKTISSSGTVLRPPYGSDDKKVTLEAVVTKGSFSSKKSFELLVRENEPTDEDLIKIELEKVKVGYQNGENETNVKSSVDLISRGMYGCNISWESSVTETINPVDGTVLRPEPGSEKYKVVELTARLTRGNISKEKKFTLNVIPKETDYDSILNRDMSEIEKYIITLNEYVKVYNDLIKYCDGTIISNSNSISNNNNNAKVAVNCNNGNLVFAYSDDGLSMVDSINRNSQDLFNNMDFRNILIDRYNGFSPMNLHYLQMMFSQMSNVQKFNYDEDIISINEVLTSKNTNNYGGQYNLILDTLFHRLYFDSHMMPNSYNVYELYEKLKYSIIKAQNSNYISNTNNRMDSLKKPKYFNQDGFIQFFNSVKYNFFKNELNGLGAEKLLSNGSLKRVTFDSQVTSLLESNDLTQIIEYLKVEGGKSTKLKIKLNIEEKVIEKEFDLSLPIVLKDNDTLVKEALNETLLTYAQGDSQEKVTSNVTFKKYTKTGVTIDWESGNPNIIDTDGNVRRPSFTDGDKDVVVKAVLYRGKSIMEKESKLHFPKLDMTDEEAVNADLKALKLFDVDEDIVEEGSSVVKNLKLPNEGCNRTKILWKTTPEKVVMLDGSVVRPEEKDGDANVELTATIVKGEALKSQTFKFKVPFIKAARRIEDAKKKVIEDIIKDLGGKPEVFEDINLPSKGPNDTDITWKSSNPDVINDEGKVKRPEFEKGDAKVILTGTISKGKESDTFELEFTVPKEMYVYVDNVVIDNSAKERVTNTDDGKIKNDLTLTSTNVADKLKEGSILTFDFEKRKGDINAKLNGDMVKKMENKNANVEIKSQLGTYTIPASQMNIDRIAEQLKANKSDLRNIDISIDMKKSGLEKVALLNKIAKINEFTPVFEPMDFEITAEFKGRNVSVDLFKSFVTRRIELPANVDASKIKTAVVIGDDFSVTHVPTKVEVIGGKYYATINSLTNSTYSLIWNDDTFKDVENHWCKEAVNDFGGRTVVKGRTTNKFGPENNVTRAEFALMLISTLGIAPSNEIGKAKIFSDVASRAWFYGSVQKAKDFGFINGYSDGSFKPDDTITRQDAVVMIFKAMEITGVKTKLSNAEIADIFKSYKDGETVGVYAQKAFATCLKEKVITGFNDGSVMPYNKLRRAEAVVILRKILMNAGLI